MFMKSDSYMVLYRRGIIYEWFQLSMMISTDLL